MNGSSLRFTFSCQRCQSVLEAAGNQSGQHGRCPTCGAVFVIPSVNERTGVAAGPAQVTDDGQLPTPMHAYATAGDKAPKIERLPSGEQVIVCPRCGRQGSIDSNTCRTCGLPFTIEGAAAVVQDTGSGDTLSNAALVVGVLSIPTFCFPALPVIAIVLGTLALRRMRASDPARRSAWIGIICGLVAIFGFIWWMYIK